MCRLAFSQGDCVCVCSLLAPPSLAALGRVLLCPQPTAVPGEGLTLPSVQPESTGCSRDTVTHDIPPWATLGSGPRRPRQWGWGHSYVGGHVRARGMRVGVGWGDDRPNRFRLHCPASLPGCLPRAGGGRKGMNPMASERLGGAWTAPHGLSSAGHPAPRPGRQEEPGWSFSDQAPFSAPVLTLETKCPIYYSANLTMPQ